MVLFPTILLIASSCSNLNSCQFSQLDSWQGVPSSVSVEECIARRGDFPDDETGCFVLAGEDARTLTLENIETGEWVEIDKD